MKVQIQRRHAAGFSLMELIVVVAIIVVLAALTLGALSLINQRQAREKAGVQIKLLENALAKYQLDNRSYPPSTDAEGRKGDEVLYKYLYYDAYEARQNGTNNAEIYLVELDPNNNTKGGQAWIQGTGANAKIVDPWGEPYRYRSGDAPNALNPDFDLWSSGPDKKTNTDPKHPDCLDDIKSWGH